MGTTLSAQIDPGLKGELQRIAGIEHRSLSNLVSLFLSRGVSTYARSALLSEPRKPGAGERRKGAAA